MGNLFPDTGKSFPLGKNLEPEEIKSLLAEGWAFRIKESHGKRYITRRKGGKERSIGPYSEDLWNLINKGQKPAKASSTETKEHEAVTTASSLESSMNILSRIESLESEVKQLKSLSDPVKVKIAKCCHIASQHGKKYCKTWSWEIRPNNLAKILPNVSFRKEKIYGEARWHVSPHPEICGPCTKFMENLPLSSDQLFRLHELLGAIRSR
jgi:hypothetical protein